MISRRNFLSVAGAGLLTVPLVRSAPPSNKRKSMAIVTTEWRMRSHGQHMGDRFLVGYPKEGQWHQPGLDVVALYVDQIPANDLSKQRATEFGFTIYPSIAAALCRGGDKLAVDAVLTIGEHGNYPTNDIGQKRYPRYEFFEQVVEVFKKSGRCAPVFNDKHLSWKWEWARAMVDTAHTMGFPLMASSSLPVTWRMPAIDMPWGAEVREIVGIAMGAVDSYDFHALEMIQCMAERRRGAETGVVALQALRGDPVWKAMAAGSWEAGGWDPQLFEACLCRSQELAQPPNFNHRHPTSGQMRAWVKDPVAYRFEYADGLKATMLLLNGVVGDFTFAARLQGQTEPLSTLFYLPGGPNVQYSAVLMSKVEEMFLTGKVPYPVERTLLTTGLVAAGMRSLASGQKRLPTPHLAIRYQGPQESVFARS
jgi:hypothetical protein